MSRPVTKLSLTYCDKLRIVCAEAKRIPNVGGGSRAVAHNIGINRTTLSKAMNGKPVSLPVAGVIKKYVDKHYKETKPQELTANGISRERFEALLRDGFKIHDEYIEIVYRAVWEAKTKSRITNGRKVALTR